MVQTNIRRLQLKRGYQIKRWIDSHKVLFAVIAIAVILLIGSQVFTATYYKNKAAPHTTIANTAVGGQNEAQLKKTIQSLRSNIKLSLKYGGKSVTANADDLGIKIDENGVTKKALATSKNLPMVTLLSHTDIKLAGSYDKTKVKSYIEANFPELVTKPVDAIVAYSGDLNQYVVQKSSQGKSVKMEGVYAAVDKLLASPRLSSYTITVDTAAPGISDESAQRTADKLNQTLAAGIIITNNGKTIWTIDPWTIADWATLKADTASGMYTVTFNRDKIKNFISNTVAKQLPNQPVNSKAIADGSGNIIATISPGHNGQVASNVDDVSGKVYDAVSNGKSATINLESKDSPYKINKTIAKDGHWIEANLSDYSVKLYDGQNVVWSTNHTAHGKADTPTITGLYTVWRKVENQCMPNPPSDQPLCNIHWVTYWEKSGYAFHEAWWLTGAKEHTGISHGCINMYQSDAKTVYDWASIGTPVWVHY